jgi:hypothetical protein
MCLGSAGLRWSPSAEIDPRASQYWGEGPGAEELILSNRGIRRRKRRPCSRGFIVCVNVSIRWSTWNRELYRQRASVRHDAADNANSECCATRSRHRCSEQSSGRPVAHIEVRACTSLTGHSARTAGASTRLRPFTGLTKLCSFILSVTLAGEIAAHGERQRKFR